MTRRGWRPETYDAETSSPPCSLAEVDPAYSGLDADTLGRARWRARRALRRLGGEDGRAGAARRRRTVRLAGL